MRKKLRLMASNINIEGLSDLVIDGLAQAQLDFQLIDYYKLLVTSFIQAGKGDAASEYLSKLGSLITMTKDESVSKAEEMASILDGLEKMVVEIDVSSLSLPQNALILKDEIRTK